MEIISFLGHSKLMTKKNVIIIGAGIAGRLLQADIKKNYVGVHVIGFIDDVKRKGIEVLCDINGLRELVKTYQIDEMVIAIPSADGSLVRRILMNNINNRIPIRIVPREQRVIRHNDVKYGSVRDLVDEDWLGRPPEMRSIKNLERQYKDKVILVTGGAGSIGSEIVRQLLELKVKKVAVMDNSEFFVYGLEQELRELKVKKSKYELLIGSVVDKLRTREVIKKIKPDIVFHAAAYKHVHLMEDCAGEAVKTNVMGTKNVVDMAIEFGVDKFVLVSTDKAVNPTSVMGATKKIAELYVQGLKNSATRYSIVRFGNVINSQGSVLPMFNKQVMQKKSVTVTDKKMKRYFMSIREAAQLVIMSATRITQGAVYVLNMGDLISINDVVKCVIRCHNLIPGKDINIKIVGRRPGEKMIEELFSEEEKKSVKKTTLPNIWRLHNGKINIRKREEVVNHLKQMLDKSVIDKKIISYLRTMFVSLS